MSGRDLLQRPDTLTWLFAGDSVTQGVLYTHGWRSYSQIVAERINGELGRKLDIVLNTAVSGWTLREFEQDLDHRVLRFEPDIVFMMFGLNDAAWFEIAGIAEYRARYERCLDRMQERSEVVLQTCNLLLPDDPLGPTVSAYVETIRSIAADRGLGLVDHDRAWAELDATGPRERFIDWGVHPNEHGHRLMAREVLLYLGGWDPTSSTGRQMPL